MRYSKPPIQEAVLDIQTALPPEISVEGLREFHMGLESRFPEEKKKINLFHGVEFNPAGETTNMAATLEKKESTTNPAVHGAIQLKQADTALQNLYTVKCK